MGTCFSVCEINFHSLLCPFVFSEVLVLVIGQCKKTHYCKEDRVEIGSEWLSSSSDKLLG